MSKIYEFGNSICIVKDKISAFVRDPENETKLLFFIEGAPNYISIQHSSVQERDLSYKSIKEDFSSDD